MDWKKLNDEKRLIAINGRYSCLDTDYCLDNPITIYLPFQSKNAKAYSSNNIELLFQASKCSNHNDICTLINTGDSNSSKILIKNCNIRKDFNRIKIKVIKELLNKKFISCELFRETLLSVPYDKYIVKLNDNKDKYFGVCSKTFIGKNILGELLTKLKIKNRKYAVQFKSFLREFSKNNKGYMFFKNTNFYFEKVKYEDEYISNNIKSVALIEFCKNNCLKINEYEWLLEVV